MQIYIMNRRVIAVSEMSEGAINNFGDFYPKDEDFDEQKCM